MERQILFLLFLVLTHIWGSHCFSLERTLNAPHTLSPFPLVLNKQASGCWTRAATRDTASTASAFDEEQEECPRGYYLDSVNQRCNSLGPLGRVSQLVETMGPLKKASRRISSLFGIDPHRISSLGVAFALSYSVISNINGSISLSIAWYISCQNTGLSPLAPGQWKSLLKAYGTIYALIQLLRPFRVAAAVAMSKLSGEFLTKTQEKLNCSRAFAIFFQYALGWVAWMFLATFGIALASLCSGVPVV